VFDIGKALVLIFDAPPREKKPSFHLYNKLSRLRNAPKREFRKRHLHNSQ
jgi:hypothetical protein